MGEANGSYDAVRKADGVPVPQRAIPVRAGRETLLTFALKAPVVGVHSVTVGGLTSLLTVRP